MSLKSEALLEGAPVAPLTLRFAAPPDFERPQDADADNRYAVTLRRADADGDAMAVTVRVDDRDEPGRAVLQPPRPAVGEPVTVSLSDPDLPDSAPAPTVQWERWRGPGEWQAIPQATGLRYTPTAADAGRPLRAVLSWTDRHGPDRRAVAELPNPVVGPMLSALAARTDSARSRPASEDAGPRPAFDPRILHYGVRCGERDVMTVAFSAPPGVRVSVNGIQPRPGREGSAAVPVTPTSDVAVTVAAPDGAWTTYTLHCMPPELWAIRTGPDPARPLGVLIAMARGPWAAVIDGHGVSRAHVRAEGDGAGFFLRPFGAGPDLRWAHAGPAGGSGFRVRSWTVLDRTLAPLRTVATAAPLTTTGQHDFRLLADGSALLMTHEPSVRDLSGLAFPDREGKPYGAAVEMEDSAIQLRGPDGAVRWTWNSWGRLPLEDCAQHWFPGNWAHVNAIEWTDQGVLASFRGCSTVVMIDPAAPAGEEIVWRLGASNLDPEDWKRRGLGPPPLRIVGDPEGEFCGQHAAQLLPPPPGLRLPRLLLFDNGVACVIDPRTGKLLGRPSGVYSRAVEYALDLEHGEAVFVRDHALRGTRDMLGHAGGHVEPLPDGNWLVSWGGPGRLPPTDIGGKLPEDAATRVDPATGMESFRMPAEGGRGVRALPVSPLALMRAPGRLDAVLPDVAPAGHGGAGETVEIAVAFSRPVAAFGPETGSVEVSGGALAEVAPLDGYLDTGLGAPLQHGEAGVEAGAPSCIGPPVDRHGEHASGRRTEAGEGVCPSGVAGYAVRRGNGDQPSARRQHRNRRAGMAQVGVVPDAVDPGCDRERRVHQHDGRPDVAQPVGDGLGVERGDHGLGEEPGQQPGAGLRVLVEMNMAGGTVAERAFRHDGQHAGAGRRLQHGVSRPDRGGLERGIGERQRGRELLEPHLLLGAPRVGGLQRGDRLQHRQHTARPAGAPAHAPAVELEKQDTGGFGGLVGVLPDPGAGGVRSAESVRHGVPQGGGVEGPAGFQDRQQGSGRGEQGIARHRTGRRRGRVDGGGGKGRTREGVRRLRGVEHGAVSVLKGIGPALAGYGERLSPRLRRPAPDTLDGLLPAGRATADAGGRAARQRGRDGAGLRRSGKARAWYRSDASVRQSVDCRQRTRSLSRRRTVRRSRKERPLRRQAQVYSGCGPGSASSLRMS